MSEQQEGSLYFDDRSIKEPVEQAAELVEVLPNQTQDSRLRMTVLTSLSKREDLRWVREMKDALQRGDKREADWAWERLEKKHTAMVIGIVGRYITAYHAGRLAHAKPGDYEPEDIPNRAFAKMWLSIVGEETVPDDFDFEIDLRKITTGLCIDAWRRSSAWKETDSFDSQGAEDEEGQRTSLADLHPDRAPTPDQIVERKEMRARLHAALAQLPERQRIVLLAREQDGLSWGEIARLIGASKRTAQYEHERARETLRRLLPDLI